MVLVPVSMRVPTLCASQPISVTLANVKSAPSLPVRRAPISHIWPVAGLSAAPAKIYGSAVAGIVGKMGCAVRCRTAYMKLIDCCGGDSLMSVVMRSCRSWGRRVGGRILVGGDRWQGGETTINSTVFWHVGGGDGHSAVGTPMPAHPGEMRGMESAESAVVICSGALTGATDIASVYHFYSNI